MMSVTELIFVNGIVSEVDKYFSASLFAHIYTNTYKHLYF